MSEELSITALLKLKHGDLWNAAKQMGGVQELADHLGINRSKMYRLCALRDTIPVQPNRHWPAKRLRAVEKKLFDLTGKTIEELFPQQLREATEFLNSDKTFESTQNIPIVGLLKYADETRERLQAPETSAAAERSELVELIKKSLKSLSYREREVLKLRFGLEDGLAMTLEEVGHVFKVSRERIRSIEATAIRKLMQPSRAGALVGYAPSGPPIHQPAPKERSLKEKYGLIENPPPSGPKPPEPTHQDCA